MLTGKLILEIHDPTRIREETIYKTNGNIGGKFGPENKDSTRLEDLSLIKSTLALCTMTFTLI